MIWTWGSGKVRVSKGSHLGCLLFLKHLRFNGYGCIIRSLLTERNSKWYRQQYQPPTSAGVKIRRRMMDRPRVGFTTTARTEVAHTVSDYNFKRLAPFTQRGANFPDGIIRVRRTSLVISPDVIEAMVSHVYDDGNGNERIKLAFGVDKKKKAIQLHVDQSGFTVQIRKNSAGYLNTTRIDFGLPIGDYKLVVGKTSWIFELAK